MRRIFLIAAVAVIGTVLAAEPASAAVPAPDGEIKKSHGPYRGIGVIDPEVASPAQTVGLKIVPGGRAVFRARVKNTGNKVRDIRFAGPGGLPGFKPRYTVDGNDVTHRAVAGTLRFRDVPAGATTPNVRIDVKVRAFTPPGTQFGGPVVFYDPDSVQLADDHLEYRVTAR